MSFNFDTFISQNDMLIREGRVEDVRRNLKKISKLKIERSYRASLANLAKRVGLPEVALGLLFNILRQEQEFAKKPTNKEKLEYASALIMMGAQSEALELLAQTDFNIEPQVLLAQSICYFTTWDYPQAVPLLQKYIQIEKNEYFQIVGKLNLTAALMFTGNYAESKKFALEVFNYGKQSNLKMIQANALEILAQDEIISGNLKEALANLQTAESVLGNDFSRPALWIKKWQAMVKFMEGEKEESLRLINNVQDKAQEWDVYETYRDCLLFKSVFMGNKKEFLTLYFSTPFKNYRNRALKLFNQYNTPIEIPKEYIINNSKSVFDFRMGKTLDDSFVLKPYQSLHRVMMALGRDFVRPTRVADIHSFVYPGTYYNHLTTPHQIHELILRLRSVIKKAKLKMDIEKTQSGYILKAQCGLRLLSQGSDITSKNEVLLERFKQSWGSEQFKTTDLMKILEVSRNTAMQIITSALNKGELESQGRGRSTCLQWK